MTRRSVFGGVALALVLGALGAVWLPRACTKRPDRVAIPRGGDSGLTFFVWSDQHVKRDGNADHLQPTIEAMNALPGTAYPPSIGGKVGQPEFVLGCGDCTDWPSAEARDAFAKVVGQIKVPTFDVMGNHDYGDEKATDRLMAKWIEARHGSLNYSFDCGGVHFAAFDAKANARQHIAPEAIQWLKADLAKVPEGRPVVIVNHYSLDAILNKDEFFSAFGNANVVLVLGGHIHRPAVQQYRGYNFIQVGWPTQFWAVRIRSGRVQAALYDAKRGEWVDAFRLDAPLSRPATSRGSTIPAH